MRHTESFTPAPDLNPDLENPESYLAALEVELAADPEIATTLAALIENDESVGDQHENLIPFAAGIIVKAETDAKHRKQEPSTNWGVIWTPKNDGSNNYKHDGDGFRDNDDTW